MQTIVSARLYCPETLNDLLGVSERHVVARGHSSIFVWDAQSGERLLQVPAPGPRFTDTAWIESTRDAVTIARTQGPSLTFGLATGAITSSSPVIPGARIRPDDFGAKEAIIELEDRTITVRRDQRIFGSAIARNGSRIALALTDRIDVLDLPSTEVVRTFAGHWSYHDVSISSDGAHVAYGAERLRIGEVASGQVRFADDPAGRVVALGFAPGGEIVIVDAIDGARFFERDPIRVRLLVPEVCSAPHFAEDGSFVAAGPRFIGRWDARTGKSLGRADLGGKISALHVSRDARRAAVTTYETDGLCYIPHEDIVVWDLETYRELARVRGEPDDSAPDPASALSPDGAALAMIRDEDIVLLEVPGLRELGRWLGRGEEPFYFDRAGRLQVGPGSLDGAMDWRHIAEAISADSHTVVFADRDGRVMMDRR